MKRRTRYVLAAVVILAMVMACGCGDTDDEGEELTENVPDFTIEAVNRCDDEVYEIGYEAYLGDEVINSGSSINAEGGEIDSAIFDFKYASAFCRFCAIFPIGVEVLLCWIISSSPLPILYQKTTQKASKNNTIFVIF